jgi:translation initiation factor IF-2
MGTAPRAASTARFPWRRSAPSPGGELCRADSLDRTSRPLLRRSPPKNSRCSSRAKNRPSARAPLPRAARMTSSPSSRRPRKGPATSPPSSSTSAAATRTRPPSARFSPGPARRCGTCTTRSRSGSKTSQSISSARTASPNPPVCPRSAAARRPINRTAPKSRPSSPASPRRTTTTSGSTEPSPRALTAAPGATREQRRLPPSTRAIRSRASSGWPRSSATTSA